MASPEIRFISDPGRRWDRIVLSGALGLLMFAILAFGTTEPWSVFVLRAGAGLLLVAWTMGRVFAADSKIVVSPLLYPAAFLMLIIAAQWAGLSAYRYATMAEGMNYIAYGILLFIAVQCVRTEPDARVVVFSFAGFGGLLSIVSIIQGLSDTNKLLFLRTPRVYSLMYGPYVNHNHYAGMMEMVAPFLIVYAASERIRGAQRAIVAFAALMASASIFLSRSRGGMLAFVVQAAFLIALLAPARTGRRTRQIAALTIVVLLALLLWLGGGALLERVGSIGDVSANQMRINIAKDCLRMFAERPLLGWGLGTFPVVYPPHRSFFALEFVNQAHNDYAQLLVEAGLAGVVAMFWYLFVLFRSGLAKIEGPPLRSWSEIATLAALAGCVGLLVHSFFDFNLHIPANAALFFFLGGIAVAEVRVDNKKSRRHTSDASVVVN